MQVKEYKLKITGIKDEAPNVKSFRARIPAGDKIDFKAGQFFMVSLPGDPKLRRAYSISSAPSEGKYIEITLDKVGKFSSRLFEAKEGDEITFTGPYGKFYFGNEPNDIVLVGAGTGIAPLMSVIRECSKKNIPNSVRLLYSAKLPESIIFRDEIEKISNENEKFTKVFTATRLPGGDESWSGRRGRIDRELLEQSIHDKNGSIFFLCGSNEFVKGVISMLSEIGIQKEQIRTDIWG
ncbi:hypothetical protein J4212_06790 [Candidatus Woesearchaeota archaeon]|nr:hypothetical protein [Candidatus Woesearchaeota archaeon]